MYFRLHFKKDRESIMVGRDVNRSRKQGYVFEGGF